MGAGEQVRGRVGREGLMGPDVKVRQHREPRPPVPLNFPVTRWARTQGGTSHQAPPLAPRPRPWAGDPAPCRRASPSPPKSALAEPEPRASELSGPG